MMGKIATHTESSLDYAKILDEKMHFDTGKSITGAIGQATCDIAQDLRLPGYSHRLGDRPHRPRRFALPAPRADHLRDQPAGDL